MAKQQQHPGITQPDEVRTKNIQSDREETQQQQQQQKKLTAAGNVKKNGPPAHDSSNNDADAPVQYEARIELCSFAEDGIGAIKRAIRAGCEASALLLSSPLKVTVSRAPEYSLVVQAHDPGKATAALQAAIAAITRQVVSQQGYCTVKVPPRSLVG